MAPRILDIGCGIGTYVRRFRAFSDDVHGVEVEEERVREASLELPNIQMARGEALPSPTTTSTWCSRTRSSSTWTTTGGPSRRRST
ncbi:MAG: hypothetical protein U0667_08925 [Chloroflexota bacterium]